MDAEKSTTVAYFEACQLEPVTAGEDESSFFSTIIPTAELDEDNVAFETTSFYLDASGRSKMSLPLKLTFDSQEALDHFLALDSIQPIPTNVVQDEDAHRRRYEALRDTQFKTSLGFEVTTAKPSSRIVAGETPPTSMQSIMSSNSGIHSGKHREWVEGISVTTSRIEGTTIYFQTQVIVRSLHHSSQKLATNLHVVAVLSEQRRDPEPEYGAVKQTKPVVTYDEFPDFNLESTHATARVRQSRLEPFVLQVTLTDALAIDVTSVNGPTTGRTIVSLTMRHPNTHREPVTITNIAMHPGHSRLELPSPPSQMQDFNSQHQQGQQQNRNHAHNQLTHTVADMSKCVQWGYAPQTAPILPFTLYPHGAFATVLKIDAMEHMRSRTFKSPISVTSVVGSNSNSNTNSNTNTNIPTTTEKAPESKEGEADGEDGKNTNDSTDPPPAAPAPPASTPLISSADAQWTTGRLAQEPSDAFRIDMQLQNKEFYVGEPFTIFLRVKNMSSEARDMMLLVAKDSDKSSTNTTASSMSAATTTAGGGGGNAAMNKSYQQQREAAPPARASAANTAVVSEVNGYTFGVWGLVADVGDPIFRLDRDQDLLAIDAALLLGEVKGHHSVEAQLRFNPLREGTLDVPNMQLFDKRNRKWYYCTHKLNIVAKKRGDTTPAVGTSAAANSNADDVEA